MDIEKAISLNSSHPRKCDFQPALKKRRRIESEGLPFITPGAIHPLGSARQTDARINNSWQILCHFAAFINNILRLLPVGSESRRSQLGRSAARRGAADRCRLSERIEALV